MLVLPASRHVDFQAADALVGRDLTMATEAEMRGLFGDCEVGAEPPFGSHYGIKTYVDEHLVAEEYIVFRSGAHNRTVKMRTEDYIVLEEPCVGGFAIGD